MRSLVVSFADYRDQSHPPVRAPLVMPPMRHAELEIKLVSKNF